MNHANKHTEAAIEEENSVAKEEKKMDKSEDPDKEAQSNQTLVYTS